MTKTRSSVEEKQFFKIGDASKIVGLPAYVLRFYEEQFPWIKPERTNGKQRLYSRRNIEDLLVIKQLVQVEGLTLDGVRSKLISMTRTGELGQIRKEKSEPLRRYDEVETLKKIKRELQNILNILK